MGMIPKSPSPIRILLADADDQAREAMSAGLRDREFEVFSASTKAETLRILSEEKGPFIVFFDRLGPDVDALAVCRMLRKLPLDAPPYLVHAGKQASRSEIVRGIRAGADEVLPQPVAPDLLRTRSRAAARMIQNGKNPQAIVLKGLRDGVEQGSGELIVRDGSRVRRVLFYDHRVAFVSGTGEVASLREALQAHGLPQEDISAALEEAKFNGKGFFDVLLDWNLINSEQLRTVTRDWIEQRLAELLQSESPRVLFLPRDFKRSQGALCFELDEVLPRTDGVRDVSLAETEATPSIIPPGKSLAAWQRGIFHAPSLVPQIAERLEQTMQIEGAVSAAVIRIETGRCEGWSGAPLDPEVVWPVLRMVSGLNGTGDAPEDVSFTVKEEIHLVRLLEGGDSLIAYLVAQRSAASFGMYRAAFAKICASPLDLPLAGASVAPESGLKNTIEQEAEDVTRWTSTQQQ